jgi:stage II sporulation protein AB (anti-sigma F factor)
MPTHLRQRRTSEKAPTLHLSIPPEAEHTRTVRDAVSAFAVLHGVGDLDLEALLFAIGEALANAVEHASSRGDIEVFAEVDERELTATIIDYGHGFVAPAELQALPDPLSERGRGIPIMQRFVDRFTVESAPERGTAVRLTRRRRQYRQEMGTIP